jgi:MFS family permease
MQSYYLNIVLNGIGITSPEKQNLINGILNICNYGSAILGAFLVDRAGRRPLFLTSTAGMTVCYASEWAALTTLDLPMRRRAYPLAQTRTVWTACYATYVKSAAAVTAGTRQEPNSAAGYMVIVMIFIYYTFYNLAMSPLLVSYTVEM